MDKVALGRSGEIFVLKNILERGWVLENVKSLEGSDWAFSKDGVIIKIQVKTSLNTTSFSLGSNLNNKRFDFMIFTNLKDSWIIHRALVKNQNRLNNKQKNNLKNKYYLLGKSNFELFSELNDLGFSTGDLRNLID